MKILIKVTKDVLRRSMMCGESESDNIGKNCAIALAVCQLLPNSTVDVHAISSHRLIPRQYFINIYRTESELTDNFVCAIPLPIEAEQFVDDFDALTPVQRLEMEPMSFEIDLPGKVIDLITISEAYRILSESNTLELVMPK
jgi:hypothetical protein